MDEAVRLPSRYAPALYREKLLIAATGMTGQLALKLHRHPSAYLVLSCTTHVCVTSTCIVTLTFTHNIQWNRCCGVEAEHAKVG